MNLFFVSILWFCLLGLYDCASEKLPVSVLILAWNNPLSLKHSLQSYKKSGFFEMASEYIIFFNELTEEKVQSVKDYPLQVIGHTDNVYIARSMQMLFAAAQYPYAMFVEKDFSIEIDYSLVLPELKIAVDTISSGSAVVYHLRSQVLPGEPLFAKTIYAGKERSAVASNAIHLCTFSSWINNTVERWPEVFKQCGEHKVTCVDSANCNWTNNPFLTSLKFWNENMNAVMMKLFEKHKLGRRTKDRSPGFAHLVEPFIKREPSLWRDKHYMIATGKGVFTHVEIDE